MARRNKPRDVRRRYSAADARGVLRQAIVANTTPGLSTEQECRSNWLRLTPIERKAHIDGYWSPNVARRLHQPGGKTR